MHLVLVLLWVQFYISSLPVFLRLYKNKANKFHSTKHRSNWKLFSNPDLHRLVGYYPYPTSVMTRFSLCMDIKQSITCIWIPFFNVIRLHRHIFWRSDGLLTQCIWLCDVLNKQIWKNKDFNMSTYEVKEKIKWQLVLLMKSIYLMKYPCLRES